MKDAKVAAKPAKATAKKPTKAVKPATKKSSNKPTKPVAKKAVKRPNWFVRVWHKIVKFFS